jgi:hypothetical protein
VEEVKSEMVCLKSGQQDVEFERLTLPDQVIFENHTRNLIFSNLGHLEMDLLEKCN